MLAAAWAREKSPMVMKKKRPDCLIIICMEFAIILCSLVATGFQTSASHVQMIQWCRGCISFGRIVLILRIFRLKFIDCVTVPVSVASTDQSLPASSTEPGSVKYSPSLVSKSAQSWIRHKFHGQLSQIVMIQMTPQKKLTRHM